MNTGNKISIPDQIRAALDGRTQRWLALEIKMPEDSLSKRMKGIAEFSQEEIERINARLSVNITL